MPARTRAGGDEHLGGRAAPRRGVGDRVERHHGPRAAGKYSTAIGTAGYQMLDPRDAPTRSRPRRCTSPPGSSWRRAAVALVAGVPDRSTPQELTSPPPGEVGTPTSSSSSVLTWPASPHHDGHDHDHRHHLGRLTPGRAGPARRYVRPSMSPAEDDVVRTLRTDSPAGAAILLDFDGTALAPIVDDPAVARPLPGVAEVLTALASVYRTVAVISGRAGAPPADTSRSTALHSIGLYGLERVRDGAVKEDPRRQRMASRPSTLGGIGRRPGGAARGARWSTRACRSHAPRAAPQPEVAEAARRRRAAAASCGGAPRPAGRRGDRRTPPRRSTWTRAPWSPASSTAVTRPASSATTSVTCRRSTRSTGSGRGGTPP